MQLRWKFIYNIGVFVLIITFEKWFFKRDVVKREIKLIFFLYKCKSFLTKNIFPIFFYCTSLYIKFIFNVLFFIFFSYIYIEYL